MSEETTSVDGFERLFGKPGSRAALPAADLFAAACSGAGGDDPAALAVACAAHALADRYEIGERIGTGGMGSVYLGRHPGLNRTVALKILALPEARSSEFRLRGEREARLLATLDHPGIVRVYDCGEFDGGIFVAMELVEGGDLASLLAAGPLPPAKVLTLVREALDGLSYAHSRGVIHRDIKPANLLLDSGGHVKIGDFGIARMAGGTPESGLTSEGQALGTPLYMAPEQRTASATVDGRADVYALGVVMYQMLTGNLPAGNFPPVSRIAPVGRRWDMAVGKALCTNPEDRWPSAEAFGAAIDELARHPSGRWRRGVALAGVPLLALAAWAFYPPASAGTDAVLLRDNFDNGDPAKNSGRGFLCEFDGVKSITENNGKLVWSANGQAWEMAAMRGLDSVSLREGGITFSFDAGEFTASRTTTDPAAADSSEYSVELGVIGGGLNPSDLERSPHSFGNQMPAVYLELVFDGGDGVKLQLAYKDGSGTGVHAVGQHGAKGSLVPAGTWKGREFRRVFLTIDGRGLSAGIDGETLARLPWEQTTFRPRGLLALGDSVWPYFAAKNMWDGAGGHSMSRFVVERAK